MYSPGGKCHGVKHLGLVCIFDRMVNVSLALLKGALKCHTRRTLPFAFDDIELVIAAFLHICWVTWLDIFLCCFRLFFLSSLFDFFCWRCVSGHNFGRESVKVWPYIYSPIGNLLLSRLALALVFSGPEWMDTTVGCGLNIGLDG